MIRGFFAWSWPDSNWRLPAPPLVQWAEALRQHPDLTLDIQQAHAALQSDDAQGAALQAHAVAAWQAIPPDARAPFESAMLFVHMPADEALQALAVIMPAAPAEASRAFLDAARVWTQHRERQHTAIREWLSRRYRNTWAAAPHLGDYWLHHILDVVIAAGTWESAMVPILALARVGDATRSTPALADVFADAEALAPPWAAGAAATWSEHYLERPSDSGVWRTTASPVPRHPAIVVHLYPGASRADAEKAFKRAWARAERLIEQRVGARRRGGPINYADDMELYRAWHAWRAEGKSTRAFLEALGHHPNPRNPRIRLNRWPQPVTYDASKKALRRAWGWLRPSNDVPPSISDFIAATPGT